MTQAADWRSGPRWGVKSVLCLVHPLPLRGVHPQGSVSLDSRVASLPYESSSLATSRGNEKYGEEKQRVIYFMYHFGVFPPWCLTAPPSPRGAVGLWVLSNGAMFLQESIERFILSPGWGKVRRSRIRGSRAAANHQDANQAL
ncbi:hypothetical protein HMPREF9453_02085 [Dialister succinatiphilus YIT 11850]|uniref:Uncharacterized protein n=1 Tax=Dialister succinatiphilus YIT 11850 TaxID=742743 RepID=H1D397_9FIRM|nr:hypothetical protein HMPREF9453_02085 [Dialister succinatiphilus YIT 11850]